jgi:hypothetical protein
MAGALGGAVLGGAYDLVDTGVEIAQSAYNSIRKPDSLTPKPAETPSVASQMAKISPSPNMPSWSKDSQFPEPQQSFQKESMLLASALR